MATAGTHLCHYLHRLLPGNAFLKKGSSQEAVAAYQEVLSINPGHAETLVNLGAVCFDNNNFDQAFIYLNKALAVNPNLVNARINLAYVHYSQGNYELAAQECNHKKKSGHAVPRDLLEVLRPYLGEGN